MVPHFLVFGQGDVHFVTKHEEEIASWTFVPDIRMSSSCQTLLRSSKRCSEEISGKKRIGGGKYAAGRIQL